MKDHEINKTVLPVICAPMFLVTTPAMVVAACRAGIVGVLPRSNFRTQEDFEAALTLVRSQLREGDAPLAVNLSARTPEPELSQMLDACKRSNVNLLITALGDPAQVVRRAHEWGARVFHDVTSMRFAEKAIKADVDGLIAIGWGGGGHSGTLSPLVLVPQLRRIFDRTIVLAGGISTGAAVLAAEALGADLAYIGTRFIATAESGAPDAYKAMLVKAQAEDLVYTADVNGAFANWLKPSLEAHGLDPAALPVPGAMHSHAHLPDSARPWRDLWSAGQGVGLIDDLPTVQDLVTRLTVEYQAARASTLARRHSAASQ